MTAPAEVGVTLTDGLRVERRRGLGIAGLLSVLAVLTPLGRVQVYGRFGLVLVLAASPEIAHGFRRMTARGRPSAWFGGLITLAIGLRLAGPPGRFTPRRAM